LNRIIRRPRRTSSYSYLSNSNSVSSGGTPLLTSPSPLSSSQSNSPITTTPIIPSSEPSRNQSDVSSKGMVTTNTNNGIISSNNKICIQCGNESGNTLWKRMNDHHFMCGTCFMVEQVNSANVLSATCTKYTPPTTSIPLPPPPYFQYNQLLLSSSSPSSPTSLIPGGMLTKNTPLSMNQNQQHLPGNECSNRNSHNNEVINGKTESKESITKKESGNRKTRKRTLRSRRQPSTSSTTSSSSTSSPISSGNITPREEIQVKQEQAQVGQDQNGDQSKQEEQQGQSQDHHDHSQQYVLLQQLIQNAVMSDWMSFTTKIHDMPLIEKQMCLSVLEKKVEYLRETCQENDDISSPSSSSSLRASGSNNETMSSISSNVGMDCGLQHPKPKRASTSSTPSSTGSLSSPSSSSSFNLGMNNTRSFTQNQYPPQYSIQPPLTPSPSPSPSNSLCSSPTIANHLESRAEISVMELTNRIRMATDLHNCSSSDILN